ncbi:LysR family transcriptional regulator [Solimicrobium silvestre]|uniref:LysR substrate binding domain n=1 Tax=Solimicrobium silvestre TaxID=2099400 RepID=A0A2S9GU85_9BURK|nr:LysR family transcriptional regulator [Solimicrobium silvestre]PRC91292.1 LysR substrate binding domain [Solimicrobium silvestre]
MLDPRNIDLNLLVVFNEIFQEQQISSVAKRLNLSQPAVSNALARLRRTFDDQLFVRTKEGMQPTPFAEQLAEPIRLALNGLTEAMNVHEKFDAANSNRHFNIALTDVAELYFMPKLINHCTLLAPQVRISTERTARLDLMAEMGAGKIDVAIGAFNEVSEALYQRRLFKQNYVVMMRAEHPLAGEALSIERFMAAEHLMVASNESPYDKINQDLEKAGILDRVKFSVPHFTAVPYIISNSDLLVTVPQKLAESTALPFKLHYQHHPLNLPDLQTNIFWHRRYHQDQGNQWLRSLISEVFAE